MTEADALELIALYSANSITAFTVYISFTFGFLVTAFVAGDRLTTFQVLTASGLYSISAGSTALALVAYTQAWAAIKAESSTVLDSVPLFGGEFWVATMSVVLASGLVLSLYFMWNIRHRKIE